MTVLPPSCTRWGVSHGGGCARTKAALGRAGHVHKGGRRGAWVAGHPIAQHGAAHDVRAHALRVRQQLYLQPVARVDPMRQREGLPSLQRVLELVLIPAAAAGRLGLRPCCHPDAQHASCAAASMQSHPHTAAAACMLACMHACEGSLTSGAAGPPSRRRCPPYWSARRTGPPGGSGWPTQTRWAASACRWVPRSSAALSVQPNHTAEQPWPGAVPSVGLCQG